MSSLPAPNCILLDLDGTLVDSVRDIARSANHVRVEFGLDALEEDVVASFVGDGATQLMLRTMAGSRDAAPVGGIDADEALAAFRAHYLEHCLIDTQPYAGVLSTLQALQPVPMAIVSNKPQAMCEKIAKGLGLDAWLVAVTGARVGVPIKPDPSMLTLTLAQLGLVGLDAERTWMVGDSANDVLSGRAVGATTIGVSYGISEIGQLHSSEPVRMIDDFRELAELVEESRRTH